MTNETLPPVNENKTIPFGSRLRSAREAMGLERKDAAAQLRLNEKIIVMLEKDKYPSDLPVTFIRGYIRAYGKLLEIPEIEIKKAIEPIQPDPLELEIPRPSVKPISLPRVSSGDYFMQIFTYLIIFTLIGLVGMWWYSHTTQSAPQSIEAQANTTQTSASDSANASTNQSTPATSSAQPATTPDEKRQVSPTDNQANAVVTPAPVTNNTQAVQSNVTADAASNATSNNGTTGQTTKQQQAAQDNAAAAADSTDENDDSTNNNQTDDTETNSDNAD